jgi:hypothetical protein
VAAAITMTLGVAVGILTGPVAGAAQVGKTTESHALTPNPTLGSANGLSVAIHAWSNGLTFSFTGALPGPSEQLIFYGSGASTQKVLDDVSCIGPDYSVFITLSPGEWTGNVSLINELVPSNSFPAVNFDLEVGAEGAKPAPPTMCQSPFPNTGFVNPPVVGGAVAPDGKGYWEVGSDGSVQGFGDASWFEDASYQQPLNAPIVGMASTPDGQGYWEVAADGGVFSFGDAGYYGSTGGLQLNQPVVGMAATPDGKGYWLVASDGGVFSFGDAGYFGSAGDTHLNQPVVGIAATSTGHGYYLVASDGGIFAYGDARFHGSMGGTPLNQPVVGMATDPATGGYWEVAADGGVFSFGAPFLGSAGALPLAAPIVGMTNMPKGNGYRLIGNDGGLFAYGKAGFYGSPTSQQGGSSGYVISASG